MNCARRCGQTGQAEYARISRRPAAVFVLMPALSAAMPIPAQITPQEHVHQMSHGVMPFDMSKKAAVTAAKYPSRSKVIWSRPWSATARIAVARGTCCGLCHVRSSSCIRQRQICPPIPLTRTSSSIIFVQNAAALLSALAKTVPVRRQQPSTCAAWRASISCQSRECPLMGAPSSACLPRRGQQYE